jgi:hypothetical protein
MGCGCGKAGDPKPVSADAPNPNTRRDLPEAWWQANPAPRPEAKPATPMPQ